MGRPSKNASGETSPPHVRAANDAFGKDSPHWNLSFPVGRLTAAEILAYFPHWLKSIDVIDRFVSNGGKSKIIAAMLNKFRILPSIEISMNSVCVMMQCAMRAAGFKGWTLGEHSKVSDARTRDWEADDLDVSSFRAPYVTHPKNGSKKVENVAAEPIEFRDLARNVKEHPSGPDALDLTRCVLYAIDHPEESWRFPVDFERLVNKLGGPQTPLHSHLDTQAFKRAVVELFPLADRKKLSVTPAAKRVRFANSSTMVSTRKSDMRLATLKKRSYAEVDAIDTRTSSTGGKRRSGRIATQGVKNLREPNTDASTPDTTPYYKNDDAHGPPQKKRKSGRASSAESEFIGNYASDSETLLDAQDDFSDDILTPEPKTRRPVRASAHKSRCLTQKAISKETPKNTPSAKGAKGFTAIALEAMPAYNSNPMPQPLVPDYLIDPVLLGRAHAWETHRPDPVLAPAPVLNPSRLVVDNYSIWLYAEDGCTTREEMWTSALSSTRFNGPRKQAPFRELYRLTDPMPWDTSDWAENIRWAKEQYLYFGVDTWTEYDDHLEQITQLRRETMWVSEEAVSGGGVYHY